MRCRSVTLAGVLAWIAAAAAQTPLPDAPGRDAVKKICSNCHEIETVISARRTRIGWQAMTDDMVSRGAEGSDEDMAAVVNYLTAWFGKINVNTAPPAEMETALGLSDKEARAIAAYRERNGKFKNFEELEKVPGVGPEKLRTKRSVIAFSQ